MGVWLKWSVVVVFVACGLWFYTRPDPISQLDVHGSWEPRFKSVADLFRSNLQSGLMRGGSFAAYVDGKAVLNLWGGYADEPYTLEWKEDTITNVASLSKMVTALAFSTLVDKGYVKYDDLVTKYWPEFAQNGKENVTVNMLISHQAGLFAPDERFSFKEVVSNPAKVEKILARQKPAWPPGTAIGYHGLSIGMYVDFLARKIDTKHRPIYQIYEEDIRKPLDLDFYLATPLSEQYRIARIHQITVLNHINYILKMASYRTFLYHALLGNPWFTKLVQSLNQTELGILFLDPDLRATPIPAASGIGNAISLAKLFGLVAARTPIKGTPLLSEEVVKQLNTPSLSGTELLMKFNATVGHGTFIFTNPWGENVFGHPGAGGQIGYSDPKNKVGLAFITNYFSPFSINDDLRFVPLEKAFYDCLKIK